MSCCNEFFPAFAVFWVHVQFLGKLWSLKVCRATWQKSGQASAAGEAKGKGKGAEFREKWLRSFVVCVFSFFGLVQLRLRSALAFSVHCLCLFGWVCNALIAWAASYFSFPSKNKMIQNVTWYSYTLMRAMFEMK